MAELAGSDVERRSRGEGRDNRFREDGGNESQSKQSQEEEEASTHERESHHGADIAVEVDSGIDEIDGVSRHHANCNELEKGFPTNCTRAYVDLATCSQKAIDNRWHQAAIESVLRRKACQHRVCHALAMRAF